MRPILRRPLEVEVGGVTLYGQPPTRHEPLGHFAIQSSGWQGWDARPSMRRGASDRPYAHGSFAARGYAGARVVTIKGFSVAPSWDASLALSDRLCAVLADGGPGDLVVTEGSRCLSAQVYLVAAEVDRRGATVHGDTVLADFMLQLWAPDPRKYAPPVSFAGGAVVGQDGTAPSWPVLTVTGTSAAYTVTYGLGTLSVPAGGGTDVIDTRSGVVRRGGSRLSGVTGSLDALPPGYRGTLTVSAGTVTAQVREAYW